MQNDNLDLAADLWIMLITNVSSVLNQDMHKGIKLRTNTNSFQLIGAHTYHLIAIFGVYFVQQKLSSGTEVGKDKRFEQLMRDKYLAFILRLTKENIESENMQKIVALYDSYFSKLQNPINSPAKVLEDTLKTTFNDYTNVKFVGEAVTKQVKFGLGMLFSNKDNTKNHYLSEETLEEIAKHISLYFLKLELPK